MRCAVAALLALASPVAAQDAATGAGTRGAGTADAGARAADTPRADPRAVVAVERIWDRAAHSAFTDLLRFDGALYCAFREGSAHVHGLDGVVRVIRSRDAANWQSVARLDEAGVDLRDPKLSIAPPGRLLLTIGGSVYDGRRLVRREPRVAFSEPGGSAFSAPQPAHLDAALHSGNDWLWRVTWHAGIGYGVVYQIGERENRLLLAATDDGLRYRPVAALEVTGKPNETTLRFSPDGRMLALVRREGDDRGALLGTSAPPFREWSWRGLGTRIGGPDLVVLPDGTWLIGGRRYADDGAHTALWRVADGAEPEWLLDLPSGGDTGYPGMLVDGEHLLVSYYSSHEGKAAIWLATLRWRHLCP